MLHLALIVVGKMVLQGEKMRVTMSHCISTYLMSVRIEPASCQACVLGSTAATVATIGKYGIMKK